ncbi:PREDICTED: uncharacterized protein C19orf18 homolog [Chinchilla lanigera]|uniref:uncharacterized protein C19orf18 homolog n=1 Tax=Chinchilla lanigera TaxID=34839 RepID=UPI000698670A|nr:PREDICTED: uncharacterized protein C19orf18 homolog [Chinchilla lanigera]
MNIVQHSFMFLFLFLLEYPLRMCLPYVDGFHSVGKTTGSPGNKQSQTLRNIIKQPRRSFCVIRSPEILKISLIPKACFWNVPPLSSIAAPKDTNKLIQKVSFVAQVTQSWEDVRKSQIGKAEERQQLTLLYENVQIPLLADQEGSGFSGPKESTHLLPENEKELGKFIISVIRSKRRENIEKQKWREEQQLVKERNAMSKAKMENL